MSTSCGEKAERLNGSGLATWLGWLHQLGAPGGLTLLAVVFAAR